jgi:hypothetical protein
MLSAPKGSWMFDKQEKGGCCFVYGNSYGDAEENRERHI